MVRGFNIAAKIFLTNALMFASNCRSKSAGKCYLKEYCSIEKHHLKTCKMCKNWLLPFIIVTALICGNKTQAQVKNFKALILDKQSDEPIPFASAIFKKSKIGVLSDSAGTIFFNLKSGMIDDTLEITSVGYQPTLIPFSQMKDSTSMTLYIEVLPPQHEVFVRVKYNRALFFWRKIIAHKEKNDRHNYDNYSYEVYNKLEADLNNVNRIKLSKNPVLKKLDFVFDFTDTLSEKEPFLPVYITETISDFFYRKEPYSTREVQKAVNASEFNNESLIKQLGSTYQNVNVYSNSIPVLDKTFISPFANNADNFYNFKILDTQYLSNQRLIHFTFAPKRTGENTFDGDSWINDATYAVQKVTLRPSLDANINFVKGLTLIQEYKLIDDSTWFLFKDKFVVDFAPTGDKRLGLKGRKTTIFRNVITNNNSVLEEIKKNKTSEEIILLPNSQNLPDSFWVKNRFEPLNKNEQNIYVLLDTLQKNRVFRRYKNNLDFLTSGTKYIGNFIIGPWFNWISGNAWEGTRLRFDLATNKRFSEHWYLHAYLAYGFKDQQFKGKTEIKYQFSRKPWSYVSLSYKKDLDNGQVYYDQLGSDNIFAAFARKPNLPFKYQLIEEKKLDIFSDTYNNFSVGFSASSKQYTPLLNLPAKELFPSGDEKALKSFETVLRLRYAYQERFIDGNFYRSSLGSDFPIVEIKYTHGWKGILQSNYKYNRLDFSVSDYLKIPPYGKFYYNLFAGKVWGTLPYPFLAQQPGNDWYYHSKYSFNLMNRFEYLTDRYAGFNLEHNIGSGLFRYISFTRKLKLRQFWEAKGLLGALNEANRAMNFVGKYPFQPLDKQLYLEVGTGVDNILKFFRVDFVWRLSPRPLPDLRRDRFGVFFGFRVGL